MKINWTRYGSTAACALFYGMFLVHLMPVTVAHAIGPNLCDGTDPDYPDWIFPYACDLDVSYADQFLITDARDTYSFYASVDFTTFTGWMFSILPPVFRVRIAKCSSTYTAVPGRITTRQ